MQLTNTTVLQSPTTVLGRVGATPSRQISVRDWWHEMEEPTEMLLDPNSTFREDEAAMIRLCRDNEIAFQPSTATEDASFPMWVFTNFYRWP